MFSMEITRLIERCRQGDADALGELYRAYAGRMRSVCLRYVASKEADDVLHDAFVIIFTSFDRLRDASKAESWMMAITRNVALKYKDHLKAMPTVPLEETEIISTTEDETSVKGIPIEDVMQLLDDLPEGYAKVFRLSVFENMSHKEIAAMLGIEPHSSSSQLARAKKMLRKMMQQYWAAALLLLLIPFTLFLFKKGDTTKDEKPVIAKQKDKPNEHLPSPEDPPIEQNPVIVHQPVLRVPVIVRDTLHNYIAQAVDSITTDTLSNLTAQEQTIPDSVLTDSTDRKHKPVLPHYDMADLRPDKPFTNKSQQQKWSVELAYSGLLTERNAYSPFGFTETPLLSPTGEPPSPVTFKNWSDYAAYLSELPDELTSPTQSIIKEIALNNANQPGNDEIVRMSHHQMPITWSLALRYKLTDRFGLETGLSYSRLTSDFEMGADGNTINEQQTLHYLGIPVKGIYNIYNKNAWNLYGSLGLTTEVPLYAPLNTSYYLHGVMKATDKSHIHAPWQWSVGTGLGLQYNFTPRIGLFAEPSLQYYIPTGSSIETYRTEHPFTFTLPLGIRFTW